MKIKWFIFLTLFLTCLPFLFAQTNVLEQTNIEKLRELAKQYNSRFSSEYDRAVQAARQNNWPIWYEYPDGKAIGIQFLAANGMPVYYVTENLNAAKTVSTDRVWPGGSAGLSLTGSGMIVGEWDAARVHYSHPELTGRVTQKDSPPQYHNHSTHVAGTLIATGIVARAKGMAYQAHLNAYDWTDAESEMATAAAAGLLLSNHSYGFITGWDYNTFGDGRWAWFGAPSVSQREDYRFGFYTEYTQKWDEIAYNAPYYLIVKSAGNDRNDNGPTPGTAHWVWNGSSWVLSSSTRDPDGDYDCLPTKGVAKNILTVGAVGDIPSGYTAPGDVVMSDFSSWGPTDDGRIKPDIVGNGVEVYSCTGTSGYSTYSGTSMSSPNVCGSLVLLQQHYQNTHNSHSMRAATLKALVIHTADEAGTADGPDYQFGWGLLNMATAAKVISGDSSNHMILEEILANGATYTIEVQSSGQAPLIATISWTDPPGTPPGATLDPPDRMLVNDLDLVISRGGTSYRPWVLNPADPGRAASTGNNNTDNVEQVVIASPTAGKYTITVNHKGTLQNGNQAFALIISNITVPTASGITISTPNGGENWQCGRHGVTWTSENTSGRVKIEYTTDAEMTWNSITSSTPDDGFYSWNINPPIQSNQCKVRISDVSDASIFDTSDNFFTVDCGGGCSLALLVPSCRVAWEVGSTHKITWTPANASGTVKIEYSTDSGANWNVITTSTPDDGCYDWAIPNTPSHQCKLKISCVATPSCSVESNQVFTIGAGLVPYLQVTDISGTPGTRVTGEIKIAGNTTAIDAFGIELAFNVNHLKFIEVQKGNLTTNWIQVSGSEGTSGVITLGGFHTASIPVNSSGTIARVVFEVTCAGCGECDASHLVLQKLLDDISTMNPYCGTFTFPSVQCPLAVLIPACKVAWAPGATYPIMWDTGVTSENVKLEYSGNNGSSWSTIVDNTPDDGYYEWQIPGGTATSHQAMLRISDSQNSACHAESGTFTIGTPQTPYLMMSDIVGSLDDQVVAEINIGGNATTVKAFGFDLIFASNHLAFVQAEKADLTANWIQVAGKETGIGRATIGGFHTTAIPRNSSGTIVKVTFRVVADCQSPAASHLSFESLVDDLVNVNTICGTFRCGTVSTCVLGDVNMDGNISPTDALCAFQIFLNNGVPPADCDTECALEAADANCDDAFSPGDALIIFEHFLSGTPIECPTLAKSNSLKPGNLDLGNFSGQPGEIITIPVMVEMPQGITSFGFELYYPENMLQFVDISKSPATATWLMLDGLESSPGIITLGGFNIEPIAVTSPAVLATVRFLVKQTGNGEGELEIGNLTDDLAVATANTGSFITSVPSVPTSYALAQNYPNPFNPETEISYQLPEANHVLLTIYNISGQKIKTLVDAKMSVGRHKVCWDGKDDNGDDLSSGIYIYKLVAGSFTDSKRMILLK